MKARVASHLAAVTIGVAIAFFMTRPGASASAAGSKIESRTVAETSMKAPREERPGGSSAAMRIRSEDFRRAWEAVATTEQSLQERILLQISLLERWAEVDLETALDAAMAEPWDNDLGWVQWSSFEHPLADSFDKVFADRPLDTWTLITSDKYGVGTQLLRREWLSAVSAKNGPLVISMLGEVPPSLRAFAINSCMNEARTHPEKRQAILSGLAAYPPGPDRDEWSRIAGANGAKPN